MRSNPLFLYAILLVPDSGCTDGRACSYSRADIGRARRHEQGGRQSGLRMSAGIARARKCEAIHFFVFYKSRTAAVRMDELARTAVQTLDGLDDMSKESDSSDCE